MKKVFKLISVRGEMSECCIEFEQKNLKGLWEKNNIQCFWNDESIDWVLQFIGNKDNLIEFF